LFGTLALENTIDLPLACEALKNRQNMKKCSSTKVGCSVQVDKFKPSDRHFPKAGYLKHSDNDKVENRWKISGN
jgi:hypothetical protein